MAHKYLMSVEHYFSGEETFEVEAENKEEAMALGREKLAGDPHFTLGGNYNRKTLRVVKKVKP